VDYVPQDRLGTIPEEIRSRLAPLADLASRLRSQCVGNPYDKTINYEPDIEGPARLAKAFGRLAEGVSAVRGRSEMTNDEYELIGRVAMDTVPKRQIRVLHYLLDNQWHRTKDVASQLDMRHITANRELESLMTIKAIKRESDLEEGQELGQTTP
jgi:hypothetical protein